MSVIVKQKDAFSIAIKELVTIQVTYLAINGCDLKSLVLYENIRYITIFRRYSKRRFYSLISIRRNEAVHLSAQNGAHISGLGASFVVGALSPENVNLQRAKGQPIGFVRIKPQDVC